MLGAGICRACTSNENIKGEKVTIIERNEDDSSRK
jgi:hypothetical protein